MASFDPPVARTLLVAKVDLSADYLGTRYDLGANEFEGGTIAPQGFVHLESFAVADGIPRWRYAIADALIEVRIFMAPGANTSYLSVELLRASGAVTMRLEPFVTYRDFHSQARGARDFRVSVDGPACEVLAFATARPLRLSLEGGRCRAANQWYWNFWHAAEAERGLDALEDLLLPCVFEATLDVGHPLYFVATAESGPPAGGAEVLGDWLAQSRQLAFALPLQSPAWVLQLARAAQQFVVRRRVPTTSRDAAGQDHGTSLIAGYPWFADWGRDTLIALPGIATALGRFDVAADILRTYAGYVDGGMLPNRFPDDGARPEYNTADATLWFFAALDDYLAAHADPGLLRDLFPVLLSIIHAHVDGTRHGIHVDPADGLLHAGEPGSQLTWMDAKYGGVSFTPRVGKPVEINALWLNALNVTTRLAARLHDSSARRICQTLLSHAGANFQRFWNAERGCLYDVIDVDGGTGVDASLRPNQLFAVSLPQAILSADQMRAVVDVCARHLVTSRGLRSLDAADPAYVGRYAGAQGQRDAAYHQGTVWSWLLGPFAWAHFCVYRDAPLAQSFLLPMAEHLDEACVGSISEIFDGDPPHAPRGCFAQAWSVAEVLRAWLRLEAEISKGWSRGTMRRVNE